jgi:MOSC domain-containing protein YiiM
MSFEMNELLSSVPRAGRVEWIGVRPAHREPVVSVETVEARAGRGLTGDRFRGGASSKRQVTLIQAEHLPVLAQLLCVERVDPALLRRNIVVSGINLLALNGAFSHGRNAWARRLQRGSRARRHHCARTQRWCDPSWRSRDI